MEDNATEVEAEVEARLAVAMPEIDVLEATVTGRGDRAMLRVVVDHPDGVDHDVCAGVTQALDAAGLRDRFGIEVWSPGPERPLRTPAHFEAATGERIRIRLRQPRSDGRRNLTGRLRSVAGREVVLDVDGDPVAVASADIRRAHLIDEKGGSRG